MRRVNLQLVGCMFFVIGIFLLGIGVFLLCDGYWATTPAASEASAAELTILGAATFFILVGGCMAGGMKPRKWKLLQAEMEWAESLPIDKIPQRKLEPEEIDEKRRYANERAVPGLPDPARGISRPPPFSVLNGELSASLGPGFDSMTPMYLLDESFRIVNWNDSLSLAFDRSMDGLRGKSVLDWTFLLDNYEEVLDHGAKTFADPARTPHFDVEKVRYTSQRFGAFGATKRAYHVPKAGGDWSGWIVTLELDFDSEDQERAFRVDMFRMIEANLMWSRYAVSYDRVLLRTDSYPQLLLDILGESSLLLPIPAGARVLDLGAGTGNLTRILAEPEQRRTVVAVERNSIMAGMLRAKCHARLREDTSEPGVMLLKQDVSNLAGIPDRYFDCALMNNVLYSLEDPLLGLQEAQRVLRPGGELRITGPTASTRVDRLLRRLKGELKKKGLWARLEGDFATVQQINESFLKPMRGFQWDLAEIRQMLEKAGFEPRMTAEVYAGEAVLLSAVRRDP